MVCKLCSCDILVDTFFVHLKKDHKIGRERYFLTHDPKYDKLTGEQIDFKSIEQYQMADFTNKNNLKTWLKENKEQGLAYLSQKIKDYCTMKQLKFAPSQNELRTISSLPITNTFEYFSKKSFDKFISSIGLKSKYNYSAAPIQKRNIKTIIIDTREQKPLLFPNLKNTITKLSVGDYSEAQSSKIAVERKSGSDFRGTISKDIERFKRELQRAKDEKKYLIILVDSDIGQTIYGNHKFGAASPEFLAHRLREIYREFDNCQILFSGCREQSKRLVEKILSIGESIKNFDLQYHFDKGEL